jgi:hypothetical protein
MLRKIWYDVKKKFKEESFSYGLRNLPLCKGRLDRGFRKIIKTTPSPPCKGGD